MSTFETAAGATVPGQPEKSGLSERDAAILEFERAWWSAPSSKEAQLKQKFSMSTTQYHQVLNQIIDTPEALAADPMLVARLQRRRDSRRRV